MKHTNVIPEIFSLLDTALLSAFSNNSKDKASASRKWLIAHKSDISPESYRLLNSFGLQKKGFNIYLKKWLTQYAERRAFILDCEGITDEEWILKMGYSWEAAGGVFFTSNKDDGRTLTPSIVKAAQNKGVITLLDKASKDVHFTCELAVSAQKHYHDIISHYDKCGIPIIKNTTNKKGTTLLLSSSPQKSHLNQLIIQTPLPFYAKYINGIKQS